MKAALIAPISERAFTRMVLDLARALGWRRYHQRPARTNNGWRSAISGDVGWPDLVLVRRGVMLAWELKVGNNRTSPPQAAWLADLRACGIDARVMRPSDWPEIEQVLQGDG